MNTGMLTELRKELSRWQGVTVTMVHGRSHPRLYLEVNGKRRFMTYSKTNTDYRGVRNAVSTLRKTLTELGAEKEL